VRPARTIVYRFRFPMNLGRAAIRSPPRIVSTDTHLVDNYEWRDLAHLFVVMNMNRRDFVGSSWLEPVVEILR
jgi:lipopolysaccharide transport system ATP-binding protein